MSAAEGGDDAALPRRDRIVSACLLANEISCLTAVKMVFHEVCEKARELNVSCFPAWRAYTTPSRALFVAGSGASGAGMPFVFYFRCCCFLSRFIALSFCLTFPVLCCRWRMVP